MALAFLAALDQPPPLQPISAPAPVVAPQRPPRFSASAIASWADDAATDLKLSLPHGFTIAKRLYESPKLPASLPVFSRRSPTREWPAATVPEDFAAAARLTNFTPAQVAEFEATLNSEQLQVFRSGGRLSKRHRISLLSSMSAEDIESHAYRFPDEPSNSPPMTDDRAQAESDADRRSDAFRPTPDVQAILMVLWWVADPLWLDLCCRSLTYGMNIGFNGDEGPDGICASSAPARNLVDPDDPLQLDLLVAAMMKDISRGNASDFSEVPLFEWYKTIPAGVVPKKNEAVYRHIKDYTQRNRSDGINGSSAKVKSAWCTFDAVVRRFSKALGGLASSWDCRNAYPTIPIRPEDRHLTVSHVPGLGYSHRLRGDMGLARAGFMWEIACGKVLSTLFYVMSFSTSVAPDGTVTCSLPTIPASIIDSVNRGDPPSPLGFGVTSFNEIVLSDAARAHFEAPEQQRLLDLDTSVDLTDVSRWCDDYVEFCGDADKSFRNALALVHWHCLFGFALADDKFFPCRAAQEFYGCLFNVAEGTVSFSEEKFLKLKERVAFFVPNVKRSLHDWQCLYGLLNFFAKVFPHIKHFTISIRKLMTNARSIVSRRAGVHPDTPTTAPSIAALRDLATFDALATSVPRTFPPHVCNDDDAWRHVSVVGHTDWSSTPAPGTLGVVLLSHGLFASGPMPPIYYDPVSPSAEADSSPTGEATAVIALLHTFRALVANSVIAVFTDNETFRQKFHHEGQFKSRHSPALDQRIRDIAILLSTLNTRLLLLRVPGTLCMADHLTKSQAGREGSVLRKRLLETWPALQLSSRALSLPTNPPSLPS